MTPNLSSSMEGISLPVKHPQKSAILPRSPEKFLYHSRLLFLAGLLVFAQLSQAQDVLVGLTSNGGVEGKGTAYSIKTDGSSFTVLKGFADWGISPNSDLVRGADGNFYGMTPQGGTYNYGTVFKVSSSGTMTIIKHFNNQVDGGIPKGSLIVAKDGNFYGLTSNGGANYNGVIFKLTPSGTYSIIRSFNGNTDGYGPQGRLLQASDGNFYGMTNIGGPTGYGTIFKMTSGGTYTVLKTFKGTDGSRPYGSLIQGTDGALYGMTYNGGTYNYGVIFKITTGGTYTVLRNLNSTTDGGYPYGSLIQAKDGYLYGMTYNGGVTYSGTIFKINTSGTSFTVIRPLNVSVEGSNPEGSLIQGSDGNLYGMTYTVTGGYNGTVFKITTGGTVTVIKKFTSATDGGNPLGSLIQASDGLLYGMTYLGGKLGSGTIFKLTTGGTYTVLGNFNGALAGNTPQDNLAIAKDSAYYGVAKIGGTYNYGTIYKICGNTLSVLRSFNRNADGGTPTGGLLKAVDGNLYGTTETGGSNGGGTIFKITPSGTFTVLRHLKASTDGGSPEATLVQGTDGALYGTTNTGGTNGYGTIFRISTSGSFSVLRHFAPATDGGSSQAGLTLGKDGNLYGLSGPTTRFFKITNSGTFTVIKTLTYNTEGSNPFGNLIVGTNGYFYGTLSDGGANNAGTIVQITPTGTITVLRTLNATTDGKQPKGSLVQGSDGAFYGTTSAGGTNGVGTVFKVTTSKTFTLLRQLSMATDGGNPQSGLVLAPKNSLTAATQSVTTAEDIAKTITLTGGGSSTLSYTITTAPKNGTLSGSGATRTYTPTANYSGKDSFYFSTGVSCLASTPAKVLITVISVNDAPVLATIGNKSVAVNTTLTFTATATDVDAGQTKTFSLIGAPSGATIGSSTGIFSWKPAATGSFTFKVRVTDNGSPVLYDEEQITVTVTSGTTLLPTDPNEWQKLWDTLKASLYPNPVLDKAILSWNAEASEVSLTIVDLSGVVVFTQKYSTSGLTQLSLPVAGLKSGQYVLVLQTDKGNTALPFIKF